MPGPPWVMMMIGSKSLKTSIARMISAIRRIGRIIGMISRVNCGQKPAPRIRAAFI